MKNGFSLRTMMLTVGGFGLICGLFTSGGMSPVVAHTILVLAFAIPGGSIGYDMGGSSRSTAIGVCVAAMAGTLLIGAAVLLTELWAMW